jgi:hypothetical protein
MLRSMCVALLALAICGAGLLAADGEVVKYDKGTLVVKVGDKERTIKFDKGKPHLHAADGKLVKVEDYDKHLKAGVKVELEEEGGVVVEVLIKK